MVDIMDIIEKLNNIQNFDELIFFYNPIFKENIEQYILNTKIDDENSCISYLFGILCKENSLIDNYVLINRKTMKVVLYGGKK